MPVKNKTQFNLQNISVELQPESLSEVSSNIHFIHIKRCEPSMHLFYFTSEVIKTVPTKKASILTSHRWMLATLKLSVGKLEGQSESVFDNFFSSFIPFESRVCWSLFLTFQLWHWQEGLKVNQDII